MAMKITFPGGLKVEAEYKGYAVRTDQPKQAGGEGTAPSPFDLFFISIGTCAGYYALNFCKSRNIPTEGMTVTLDTEYSQQEKRVNKVRIDVKPPDGFPQQYKDALIRAIESCTVKKHIQKPPEFEVKAV